MILGENYTSEEFKKINGAVIFFTGIVFILATTIYYTPFLYKITGVNFLITLSSVALKIFKKAIIFKIIILLMAICSVMTFSSGLTITREKRILSGQIAAIGFAFYIILMLIETFFRISAWVGLPFHCLFFFTFFIAGCNFRKRESEDLLTDRRNEVGLEFDQHREKVSWEYSINIPYKYYYLGQERLSWINVNPLLS